MGRGRRYKHISRDGSGRVNRVEHSDSPISSEQQGCFVLIGIIILFLIISSVFGGC